jgi:hypothetical protein
VTDSGTTLRLCSEPGCVQPYRARGWCSNHYEQLWRLPRLRERELLTQPKRPTPPLAVRQRPKGFPQPVRSVLPPQTVPAPKPVKPKPTPPKPTPPKPRKWTYGAVTVCFSAHHRRTAPTATFVYWADKEEADQADAVLLDQPCGPRCGGRHLVVWHDGEREHVRNSVHAPPPPSLERELRECYGWHDPERVLPPPLPWNNPPLVEYAADTLAEWEADDAAQVTNRLDTSEMDDADKWLAEHELQEAR